MRPIPQETSDLLEGILESPNGGEVTSDNLSLTNSLPFSVYVFELTTTGDFAGIPPDGSSAAPGTPGILLAPGECLTFQSYNSYAFFLLTAAYSGGFVCVFQVPGVGGSVQITSDLLLEPNSIGPIPQPNQLQVIPPDSQCVVVGCGMAGTVCVVREQYWRRLPDSYTIAPGQTKTISFTTVEGMQNTSSSQVTIAAQMGTSASAGWGPISASISASLSASSTSFQQLTLSSETTSYVSETLTGMSSGDDQATTQMYLYWQLMDIVNLVDPTSNLVLGSIVSGAKPIVISGPFDPNALPAPPTPTSQPTDAAEAAQRRRDWVGSRIVPKAS